MSLLAIGRSDKPYFLPGLFVLAALLMLAGWLTVKVFGYAYNNHDYYAFLTDVTGIRVGTPVMVDGYKIGLVAAIDYQAAKPAASDGTSTPVSHDCVRLGEEAGPSGIDRFFRLQLSVDKMWRLTTETRVSLENPSLLGQPVIDLEPGHGSPLCGGSAIPFAPRTAAGTPDIAGLTRHAEDVLKAMEAFLEEARSEQLTGKAGALLLDSRRAITHMDQVVKEFHDLIADPRLHTIKANTESATRQFHALLEETRRMVHGAQPLAPSLTAAVNDLRPSLSGTADNLEFATRLTAASLPVLLSNLERTAQDLADLIADLRNNPPAALRGRVEETPVWEDRKKP